MLTIGITGQIGSGKSEVAQIFKSKGAYVIEADIIGHQILKNNSSARRKIIMAFGSKVLYKNSFINRKTLGSIVFSDPKMLKKLNKILHPLIKQKITSIIKKKSKSNKLLLIDAALPELFPEQVDLILLVSSKIKNRVKRLLSLGFSKKRISQIMKIQLQKKEYLKIADLVIVNDRSLYSLKKQTNNKLKFLLRKQEKWIGE